MSVIKRRHFLRSRWPPFRSPRLPYGKLFAASDLAIGNDVEAVTGDRRKSCSRPRT